MLQLSVILKRKVVNNIIKSYWKRISVQKGTHMLFNQLNNQHTFTEKLWLSVQNVLNHVVNIQVI